MKLRRLFKGSRVAQVKVLRLGKKQNFSSRLIQHAQEEGWLRIQDDTIILKGVDGPVRFRILRRPGLYCCYCNKRLHPNSGQWHLQEHSGPSPDKSNPIGYRVINSFECELE